MNRDFRRYFAAEVTSVCGSAFTVTAIGVVGVTAFAATPGELGAVSAAAILPACLLGLAAGVLGDRLRRPRRALIICDAVAGGAVLTVAIGIWRGMATIWWLAALCFLLGSIVTLAETIYFTHLRGLVGAEDLSRARARLQAGEYGASAAGKAIVGALIAALGGALAFLVDAVSYLASMLLLATIRADDRGTEPAQAAAPSWRHETAAGFRETARHPFLRLFAGFAVARSLVVGAVAALTAPFLLRTLAVPVGLYGVLFAITGAAGLAGSLLASRMATGMKLSSVALIGSTGMVLTSVVLPLAGGPALAAAGLAALGLALPVSFGAIANVGLTGALTTYVPEQVLGRAVASLRTATTGAQALGALAGGVLGSAIGLRPAMWLTAVVSLGCGVLLVPTMRASRQPAEPESQEPGESQEPAEPEVAAGEELSGVAS
jgi:predicted MFS family arabinose efflux permease